MKLHPRGRPNGRAAGHWTRRRRRRRRAMQLLWARSKLQARFCTTTTCGDSPAKDFHVRTSLSERSVFPQCNALPRCNAPRVALIYSARASWEWRIAGFSVVLGIIQLLMPVCPDWFSSDAGLFEGATGWVGQNYCLPSLLLFLRPRAGEIRVTCAEYSTHHFFRVQNSTYQNLKHLVFGEKL